MANLIIRENYLFHINENESHSDIYLCIMHSKTSYCQNVPLAYLRSL
jgi:hypothetical protein